MLHVFLAVCTVYKMFVPVIAITIFDNVYAWVEMGVHLLLPIQKYTVGLAACLTRK